MLSMVLAGEKSADEIVLNDIEWYQIEQHPHASRSEDRADRSDDAHRYRRRRPGNSLRQTDSRHRKQRVHSADPRRRKENVHVFRTLDDTRALMAKARKG